MGQFVQAGPVIVDLLEKGRLRRHLHIIMRRDIEGAVAADAEVDAARRDDRFRDRHDLAFGQRGRIGRKAGTQSLALRDVEDGKAFQEGNGLGVAAGFDGTRLFGLGYEAVGIDNGGAVLAFPDRTARFQCLAEGQPALRGKAMLDHRAPQDQHIDTGVMAGRQRIARQSGCGSAGTSPRLHPRHAPCLQFGDDPCRHLVIQVRAGGRGRCVRLL